MSMSLEDARAEARSDAAWHRAGRPICNACGDAVLVSDDGYCAGCVSRGTCSVDGCDDINAAGETMCADHVNEMEEVFSAIDFAEVRRIAKAVADRIMTRRRERAS
jgi:hypothetical protein